MTKNADKIPTIKTILYPTDLGSHMRPVFRFAISLARQYQAKIEMLHVLESLSLSSRRVMEIYLSKQEVDRLREDGFREVRHKMRKRLADFCESELGVPAEESGLILETRVMLGSPAETICDEAEKRKVDLIVMGTHTDPSLGHRLIGSTARKLTHISRIPVLIVPVTAD